MKIMESPIVKRVIKKGTLVHIGGYPFWIDEDAVVYGV